MKEFMLIFIGKDYTEIGLSPEQMQERMDKWMAWDAEMREQGITPEGHALQYKAKHVTGLEKTVTDGPYIEGKELVGGYYIIKARDLDAAAEVAKGYPDFDLGGGVEVREVMVFDS